jgi:hypothetical protein
MNKFRALKAKWYKKLALAGFEDIENDDGSLKAATDTRTIRNALKEKEERETYYTIARGFLNDPNFPEQFRAVWMEHCEGIGARTIAKKLNLTSYKVETAINEVRKLAKLRKRNE